MINYGYHQGKVMDNALNQFLSGLVPLREATFAEYAQSSQLTNHSSYAVELHFLFGGEATDEGNQHLVDDGCVQSVPAVEVGNVAVMLQEDVLAVDLVIVMPEQAPHVVAVPVGYAVKLVLFHLSEVADDFGRYGKLGSAVLTSIEEIECTRLQHL